MGKPLVPSFSNMDGGVIIMSRATSRVAILAVVAVLAMAALSSTASYARGNTGAALILGGASAYLFTHDQPGAGALTALGAIIALSGDDHDRWRHSRYYDRDDAFWFRGRGDRDDFRSFDRDRDDRHFRSFDQDRDDRRGSRNHRW
jgi:hypothetical protein